MERYASQPDAAMYYLARMVEAGEDPKFIARRMVILVMSLDSVDEIRTTRACSLSTPDARDTIRLRIALWNAPCAPVVRGRRPAVCASSGRNTARTALGSTTWPSP
jgi:hypothetical protein